MSASLISALGGGLQGIVAGASGSSKATMPTNFAIQNLPDVAQAWMWTANIYGVPNLPAFNNLVLADMTLPFEGFTADPRFRGGFTYYFPKFSNVTPSTLTFHELQTYVVTNYFAYWHNLIINPNTGDYGLPTDYFATIIATLFDTMGIPALEVTMQGCWPEKPNDLNLTTQGSNGLQVSVSMAVARSYISYASATLLDSPLAQIISGNPMASLAKFASAGVASLKSTAFQDIGSSIKGLL